MAAQSSQAVIMNDMARISQVGEALLKWIDAYFHAPGSVRTCWLSPNKKLVCMTWGDVDTSDDDDDDDDDDSPE
jgi:hypothetical protein